MVEWRLRMDRLRRCDRVFFSPHPGDVPYACAAALIAAYAADERSLVVSVFTETGVRNLPPAVVQDTHLRSQLALMSQAEPRFEKRRNSEIEAARRARYAPFLAGLTDATFRCWDGRYADVMGYLWEPAEGEPDTLDEVTHLIQAVVAATEPSEVFVPLAVGRHIDARLVHLAARRVQARLPEATAPAFWSYEDRPFAFVDQATKVRLRELGFPVAYDADRFFNSMWESPWLASLGAEVHQRPGLRGRYMEAVTRPATEARLPRSRILSHDDPDAIWRIIQAYDTQGLTFGDRRQFRRDARVEARRRRLEAPYAERHWQLPLRATA